MSIFNIMCAILWGLSLPCASCADLRVEFQKHGKMVAASRFPCRVPQPRVFYFEDLVGVADWKQKYEPVQNSISPWATILYRCEYTGCCEDKEKRCLPASIETVNLTFSITTGEKHYVQIPAKNHTSCDCLVKDNSGKQNIK